MNTITLTAPLVPVKVTPPTTARGEVFRNLRPRGRRYV